MGNQARRLRQLFNEPGVIRLIGAHNALGAALGKRCGFEGIWSSGFEISTSHAVPDASILTMSDFLAAAQSMVDAVDIPVVTDCDTGYGNSNNVMRMVRKFEAAGVAAVCVEDKLFPKVNSLLSGGRQELASIPEFVGKLVAAKAAQRTEEFMVIARVEALIAGWGVGEAVRRAEAYVRAGADAILMHDKDPAAAQLRAFLKEWSGRAPIVIVPTNFPHITAAEFESLGVKMIVYANQGLRAAVSAMETTFRKILSDGATAGVEAGIAPMKLLFELQGMPELNQAEREYHRSGAAPTRAVILTAGDHGDAASMADLAGAVPLSALDVSGKSLLRRQVEALAQAGVRDVTVVTGYRHEAVECDGVDLVHNPQWATTGEAASLMCVADDPRAPTDQRTLLVYGDILFDVELLQRVLKTDGEATIVVDRGEPHRDGRDGKRRDLVQLAAAPAPGRRFLTNGELRPLKRIGKQLGGPPDGEFTGIALLDAAGWKSLRSHYRERLAANGKRPMHEAAVADRAALTDLLQERMDAGGTVACLEVTSGWIEIHSFEDYQSACRLVAR
ncbi:MAG TPA: isocitrate lyase/phosphoenolpyruvate mutase family protein [Gemmatimonadaceae bacterium]|jgi:phosphoenolpyruvate phosphomutase